MPNDIHFFSLGDIKYSSFACVYLLGPYNMHILTYLVDSHKPKRDSKEKKTTNNTLSL